MLEEIMKEKLSCVNQKISSFLQPVALCLISYHKFHIPVSIVLFLSFSWTDENKLQTQYDIMEKNISQCGKPGVLQSMGSQSETTERLNNNNGPAKVRNSENS